MMLNRLPAVVLSVSLACGGTAAFGQAVTNCCASGSPPGCCASGGQQPPSAIATQGSGSLSQFVAHHTLERSGDVFAHALLPIS